MKKLRKICCLLTCTCLTSCGNFSNVTNQLRKAKDPLPTSYQSVQSEEFKKFMEGFTDFSLRFNDSFLTRYDDRLSNSAISPLSVFFALAMTSECTAGNSQKELLDALNMTKNDLREYLSILYSLENKTTYTYDYSSNKDVVESIKELNNSIWFSKETNKNQDTLDDLANFYFVNSYESDFLNNNRKANKDFTNYVKEKTHGLINNDFQLDNYTKLVLLNTFYLKDVWNDMGKDLSLTNENYHFINRDNSSTSSKLMIGNYVRGRVLNKDTYSSFFTHTENGLYIHFLLPNGNNNLENVFNKDNINTIINHSNYEFCNEDEKIEYYTSTLFPSFEASCDKDLSDILFEEFGIQDIFKSTADFSSISSDEMCASRVIHQTKLKVEQKGIEGAAITALATDSTSCPDGKYTPVYETFIVDRSFGYVITDSYGVTLFSGIVNKI